MNKKSICILSLGAVMLTMASCGMNKELKAYKKEVEKFYGEIEKSNEAINAIDASETTSRQQLLNELDKITDSFDKFAAVPVPIEFGSCESLADDAADYMTEANLLYHEALSGTDFDYMSAANAKAQYNNAVTCINYIGILLQGEVPEDAIITDSGDMVYQDEEDVDDENLFDDADLENEEEFEEDFEE